MKLTESIPTSLVSNILQIRRIQRSALDVLEKEANRKRKVRDKNFTKEMMYLALLYISPQKREGTNKKASMTETKRKTSSSKTKTTYKIISFK